MNNIFKQNTPNTIVFKLQTTPNAIVFKFQEILLIMESTEKSESSYYTLSFGIDSKANHHVVAMEM